MHTFEQAPPEELTEDAFERWWYDANPGYDPTPLLAPTPAAQPETPQEARAGAERTMRGLTYILAAACLALVFGGLAAWVLMRMFGLI